MEPSILLDQMNFNLFALKKELAQQGIFFEFSGPLSQTLLAEMGDILKQKMKLEDASSPTILKVFSMVVEQTQNIIHYSAEKMGMLGESRQDLSSGIIAVGMEGDTYFVITGNLVDNNDVDHLKSKLSVLATMNAEELKNYYKEQRRLNPDDRSKGAGLGFIEMARKACKPIEFDFVPVDDRFSFFSVNAHIQ